MFNNSFVDKRGLAFTLFSELTVTHTYIRTFTYVHVNLCTYVHTYRITTHQHTHWKCNFPINVYVVGKNHTGNKNYTLASTNLPLPDGLGLDLDAHVVEPCRHLVRRGVLKKQKLL